MKKCQICKKEIVDNRCLSWGRGEIHLNCYTPDKQKDYDTKETNVSYSGEKSPYWDWVDRYAPRSNDGERVELPNANPDVLSDDSSFWNLDEEENAENRKAFLQKFAKLFNRLTRRQREIMFALELHKTQKKAAEVLGISQKVVSTTLKTVQKKLLQMGIFRENEDTI